MAALAASALVVASATSRAEEAKAIQLDLGDADLGLDTDVLRRTLEDDLGVTVAVGRPGPAAQLTVGGAPTSLSLVVRRRDDRTIGIVVRSSSGAGAERLIIPPRNRVVAGETVGLAASNLLRDEAREILAALAPKAAAEPTDEARYRSLLASLAPKPPAPSPPPFSCSEGTTMPVGADFAPFIGTSSAYPNRVRWVSLNLLGGYAKGLRAVEVGVGANVESSFMCGVQVAGLANIVLGPVRGAQFAVADVATGDLQGVQVGVGNLGAETVEGAQVGTVNLSVGALSGAQLGSFNLAMASVHGAQIGAVNVAKGDVHGVQLGAVNYADDVDAPIGAVSIVRHGRTSFETSVTESGANGTLHHGGRILHNVYGVGYRFGGERWWSFMLGIGGHIPLAERFDLDVDLVYLTLQKDKLFSQDVHGATLQPSFVYKFAPPFAVWAAPTFTALVSHEGDVGGGPPWGKWDLGSSGSSLVQGWAGFALGIRAEL